MIPRVGEPIRQGQRYGPRPGVYAVLVRGTDALLTLQVASRSEFQLPGGGIDPGESTLRALHREVYEETGWRIAAPRRLGVFRRFAYLPEYDRWAEKICHVYLARPVVALSAPAEPDHSAHWVPLAAAAELVANDGDRMFLRQVASGRIG